MSYNYRQGGTPDHVDSSQSNAKYPHVGVPIAASDTTPKAPVDTVRLKKDISKDLEASNTLSNAGTSPSTLNSMLGSVNSGKDSPSSQIERASDALLDRGFARKDTLQKARQGKIPATSGKKP